MKINIPFCPCLGAIFCWAALVTTAGEVPTPKASPGIPSEAAAEQRRRGVDGPEAGDASDSYQLVPKDRLMFRIDEDENESKFNDAQILEVTSQKQIHVPVSRGVNETLPVNIAAKTLAAVRQEIKQKLEAEYYRKATIHLTLLDQSQSYGTVWFHGEVKGRFELKPGAATTLSEALLELKPSDFANLKKVRVDRLDPVTKINTSTVINVKEVLDKGNRAKDWKLQDGDRVYVPEKGINLGL